jgi:DNA replication protein DnaC
MDLVHTLQLPGQKEHYAEYLKIAQEQSLSPIKFLQFVLFEESQRKQEHLRLSRLQGAKIPELYVMDTFPFERQPNLDKNRLLTFYDSFEYVHSHKNSVFIGPTGTGKSGLATAFLVNAINKGHTGRFVLFADLVSELMRAEGSFTQNRVIKRYASYDCLVIDELGYVEVNPAQVGLFFTLLQKRHRHKCTIITTNLGFQDWLSFLKNEHLTAALIDRLTDNSFVLNMLNCVRLRNNQNYLNPQ